MEETIDKPSKNTKQPKFYLEQPKIWFLIGLIVGLLGFLAYRVAVAKNPNTHYHANFAVWINGKQDTFAGPGYYEEVTACDVHNHDDVKGHAHIHGNINSVVHVHADGVTWGDFFANLGYTLGDNLISDGNKVYTTDQDGNHLVFMLNGRPVENIANTVIKSEDVLLIDYGQDSQAALQQHYDSIPKDAHHYNVTKDPAACSGGQTFDLKARLKDALGFGDAQ